MSGSDLAKREIRSAEINPVLDTALWSLSICLLARAVPGRAWFYRVLGRNRGVGPLS